MDEGEFIVGWYVGEIVAWTRVDPSGRYVDWGECYTNGLDDIVRWLSRRKCTVFAEVIPDKVSRSCGGACVRSAGIIRRAWPGIRWISSQYLRAPVFRESIPKPPKTISVIRTRSYYVAVYGAMLASRNQ